MDTQRHPLLGAAQLLGIALALVLLACGGGNDIDPNTNLRVVNLSYDSSGFDVRVEGMLDPLNNIGYGKSSGYSALAPGRRAVRLLERTTGERINETTHQIEKSTDRTVFVINKQVEIEQIITSDARLPAENATKLRLINTVADAPGLDLRREGAADALFEDVQYKGATEYVEVDPGLLTLFFTRAGKDRALFRFQPRDFGRGKVFTLVTAGTFDDQDEEAFVVFVLEDLDEGLRSSELEMIAARVALVHASEGADRINVFVEDDPINDEPLGYGDYLPYQDLRPGRQAIEVRANTADALLTTVNLTLDPEETWTIFVANEPSQIETVLLSDDLSPPPEGKAKLRVAHMSPDTPLLNVRLKGDTANLASNIDFKQASGFVVLPAQKTLTFEFVAASSDQLLLTVPDQTLDPGRIYTLFTTGTQVQSTLGVELLRQN